VTELVRAQGRVAFWGTLRIWMVARACPRECLAPLVTKQRTVTDSRPPLLLRPPRRVEVESPPEFWNLWGAEDKCFRPKNRGSMMVSLGRLGPSASAIHPHMSVGSGLRTGPLNGTSFWRPHEIRWMRSLAR